MRQGLRMAARRDHSPGAQTPRNLHGELPGDASRAEDQNPGMSARAPLTARTQFDGRDGGVIECVGKVPKGGREMPK